MLKDSTPSQKYEKQIFRKDGHGTGIFSANVGLEDFLEQFSAKSL